jgi:hypothetical protein
MNSARRVRFWVCKHSSRPTTEALVSLTVEPFRYALAVFVPHDADPQHVDVSSHESARSHHTQHFVINTQYSSPEFFIMPDNFYIFLDIVVNYGLPSK